MSKLRKYCIDCLREVRAGAPAGQANRPAPYPGPRCHSHHRAHHEERSAKNHARYILETYGISGETYAKLLAVQGGTCICGRPPGDRRLAVDHDHSCCPGHTSCGRCVRGLLCWSCNKMLHHFHDDPELISRMADYLTNWPSFKLSDADPRIEA